MLHPQALPALAYVIPIFYSHAKLIKGTDAPSFFPILLVYFVETGISSVFFLSLSLFFFSIFTLIARDRREKEGDK